MKRTLRIGCNAVGVAVLAAVTGCAQVPLGAPVPSIDNIQQAKAARMQPVSMGAFTLAPGKELSLDQKVSVRSNAVFSPYDNSFAKYLRETLQTDLQAAGMLDAGSRTIIEGQLTDSQLDAPIGEGTGRVAARFAVKRQGVALYDKELSVSSRWNSPFVGVEAIPAAINEYVALYRKLVATLLSDPAFQQAVQK